MSELKKILDYVMLQSPFYKEFLKDYSFILNSFTFDLFEKLPFTEKRHLAEKNNEFLCVSRNNIADFVTTS